MNLNKRFGSIPFLVFIFIILVAYSVLMVTGKIPQRQYQVLNEQVSIATSTDETAGWKTYRNEKYGFEFKIPPNIGYGYTYTQGDKNVLIQEESKNNFRILDDIDNDGGYEARFTTVQPMAYAEIADEITLNGFSSSSVYVYAREISKEDLDSIVTDEKGNAREEKKIIINGLEAIDRIVEGAYGVYRVVSFFRPASTDYRVVFSQSVDENIDVYKNSERARFFENIISTFKFTN